MLVLTRYIDQTIRIGPHIKITVVRVQGNAVRIGIEAPEDVRILRGELAQPTPAVEQPERTGETANPFADDRTDPTDPAYPWLDEALQGDLFPYKTPPVDNVFSDDDNHIPFHDPRVQWACDLEEVVGSC